MIKMLSIDVLFPRGIALPIPTRCTIGLMPTGTAIKGLAYDGIRLACYPSARKPKLCESISHVSGPRQTGPDTPSISLDDIKDRSHRLRSR